MGFGDILLSMGEAKASFERTGLPVLIIGVDGRPVKHHDMFNGVPYLLTKAPKVGTYTRLINGPGARPYIASKTPTRWTWTPYKPVPAEIRFTDSELDIVAD